RLPVGGGGAGVEGLLQIAGDAADAGPVGDDAVGDTDRIGPQPAGDGIEQLPTFQRFETRTEVAATEGEGHGIAHIGSGTSSGSIDRTEAVTGDCTGGTFLLRRPVIGWRAAPPTGDGPV